MRQVSAAGRPLVVVPAAEVMQLRAQPDDLTQQLRLRKSLMKANEVAAVLQVSVDEVRALGIPNIKLSETQFRWEGSDVANWLAGRKQVAEPLLAFAAEPPTAMLDRPNLARLLRVPARTVHHLLAPDTGALWTLRRVADWVGSLKEATRAP
jgi:hypothetical protein